MECTEERGAEDLRQLSQSFGPGLSKEGLEAARQAFFELVQNTCSTAVFAEIIAERKAQIVPMRGETRGNLAELLGSPEYQTGRREPLAGLAGKQQLIEEIAQQLFKNVAEAWAHFEVYGNRKKAVAEWEQRGAGRLPAFSPEPVVKIENENSTVELIKDIALDSRLFRTPGIAVPCRLSYAVKEQVLQEIIRGEWWEALFSLALAQEGQHAIYYKTKAEQGKFWQAPALLSTGLIQEIDPLRENGNILTRDKFFRNENWQLQTNWPELKGALEKYYQENPHLKRRPLQKEAALKKAPSLAEFEEAIIEAGLVRTEIIQITSTGATQKEKFENFHNGVRGISIIPTVREASVSFTIVYKQPSIHFFKAIEELTGIKCFITLSKERIKGERLETYKILFLNENIYRAMKKVQPGLASQKMSSFMRKARRKSRKSNSDNCVKV